MDGQFHLFSFQSVLAHGQVYKSVAGSIFTEEKIEYALGRVVHAEYRTQRAALFFKVKVSVDFLYVISVSYSYIIVSGQLFKFLPVGLGSGRDIAVRS